MASSLGLYIENNLIKYAKVSKNNDAVKVESFGIKFYEKIEETIKQIIEETYSYKTPISVNLNEEKYNYFDIFGSLNKKDIEGIVKTNFENYCYDNGLNQESFEQRYVLTNSPVSKEKIRAIHMSAPKTTIARRKNQLLNYKVSNISPIGISIANILKPAKKQNCIIVNIEENTSITKISDDTIKDVRTISYGSKEVLEKINSKENSYAKSYEICKNTTIYTNDAKDLQLEENEYLEDIMPTLYNIVTEVRQVANESLEAIDKIYITGTLSVINNIDIYFQEYIKNAKCEILRPYFVNNNSKINIKDYIEVNSAIAIAIQGIDGLVKNINFTKETGAKKLAATLNTNINIPKLNELDFANLYNNHKSLVNILTSTGICLFISYIIASLAINGMLNKKYEQTQIAIADVNNKILAVREQNTKLNNRITKYKTMITNIEENNDKTSENKRYKNTIPNLMNNIMAIIPKEVQLVSMENDNSTHIIIKAKSTQYEQLAFFKTKIKTEKILKNVISDTGVAETDVKQRGMITVTIEGELP